MSLILKGIDMPKDGEMHRINIYDNGNTYITTSNMLCETDRKDVEAIQIPTPHGRIIDEDEIYEQPHCGECNDATLDAINNAPTILEAEE